MFTFLCFMYNARDEQENTLYEYAHHTVNAYRNKISNKLFGVAHIQHRGKKKGSVLLSFIVSPFTLAPWEYLTDPHPNHWTATEVARIFSEKGYDVDIINWDNTSFKPKKGYVACVDIHNYFERSTTSLPDSCIKIQYITGSHWRFQNEAEQRRLENLEKRKGVRLPATRAVTPANFEQYADFIIGYGNKTVHGSFPIPQGKRIIPLPVVPTIDYDFPKEKDFSQAKKTFLWFGGGGAILKGLDIVVEVFSSLPHLRLIIVGPASYEKEFDGVYKRELALPNITRYNRPRKRKNGDVFVDSTNLQDILSKCGAIVSLSASEGGGGATIQAMSAGVFPIVTPQTGINETAPSIVISDPTIDNVRKVIEEFSNLPEEKITRMAKDTWDFTHAHHSKNMFTKTFEHFLDSIVKLN